ncbi:MAG: lysoplasmalogenase [Kofleriaceae bacterium]
MIGLTVICALACAVLVVGEYRDAHRLRWVAKPIASLAFIAVGVCAAGHGELHGFEIAVIAGLVLGAIGDVALLSAHGFLAGLSAFLLGHLAYAVAVGHYLPPRTWPHAAGAFMLIPIVVGLGVLAWLWPKLGSLRVPVIAYVAVILAMVVAAIAFVRGDVTAVDDHRRGLFALGAILFFASDLAVARDKFVAKSFVNRAWGLPVYYAGQLLIAWSLLG